MSCGLYLGVFAIRRGSTVVVLKQFFSEALAWEPATQMWLLGCSTCCSWVLWSVILRQLEEVQPVTLRHQSPSPCFRWQFPETYSWEPLHYVLHSHIHVPQERGINAPCNCNYYTPVTSVTPIPYLPSVTSSFIWVANVITLVWSNQPAQFSNF